MAAAQMSVEKKYLASNPELNAMAISPLRYIPSVAGAQEALLTTGNGMKAAGMLQPETDVAALAKRAFAPLYGVSDDWIKDLKVQKVAGGQLPPRQDIRVFAELSSSGEKDCCLLSAK